MDWHTRSLHFQHKALECETFIRSMQNLKQKEDLGGTRRPRCPKPLFVTTKAFMKVTTRGDAFFIYVFPLPNVEPRHMKFLPCTKNSKMCLKREMQTPCPNIDHITTPLILWKEHNLHSDPSIICCKTNLECFVNISVRTSRRGSFDIQSF
jgi:hypothetical protein